MPTYQLSITEEQYHLLRGLTARAAADEAARVTRMEGRPQGFHSTASIDGARLLAGELAQLERAVIRASW